MLVPLGLYVVLLGGSIIASYEPWVSLRSLTELFTLSTLAVAPLLLRRERQVRWAVDALVVVSALVALQGLSQYLIGYGDIDRRIRGPFSHYMTFSGVLLICDLLLITTMVYAGRWRSPWRWVALAVINVAILGSYTRGAWVALGLTLTALALLRAPRLLLAWVPVAVVFAVLAPVPLLHRVTSIADVRDLSNYDRLCMMEAGLTMIRERPLFGLGPDLVRRRYAIYRPPTAPRYNVPHLHNNLLQLAAERGLPALGAYLALTGRGDDPGLAAVPARGRAAGTAGRPPRGLPARPPRLQPGRAVREQLGGYRGPEAGFVRAGDSVLPAGGGAG